MPTLATTVDGLKLPNPFVIASGPPGTNLNVISRAFREGWGAVIAKTVSLDSSKVINVTPRYAKLHRERSEGCDRLGKHRADQRSASSRSGSTNSRSAKTSIPDGVLIASIMEEYNRDAWSEIVERCQDAGRRFVRAELFLPAWIARAQDGRGDGREPGDRRGSLRLGDGGGEEAGLGEDDAERDAHHRAEPRGVARRLPGRQRRSTRSAA